MSPISNFRNTGATLVASPIRTVFALMLILGLPHIAKAQITWNGITSANWSNAANWTPSAAAPGAADTALFKTNQANGTTTALVIDTTTVNDLSMSFDTAAGNYVIGTTAGNSIKLASGGTIQILGTLSSTNALETINAPLSILGANASYTFANNSANGIGAGAGRIVFGGAISGGTAGATVLTLGGSNTNDNIISGIISNGTATTMAVVKTGLGKWVFTGVNSYTGGTTVSQGTLNIGGGTATGTLLTAGGITVASGATLAYQFSNAYTAPALTVTGNLSYASSSTLSITGTYDANQITATGLTVSYTGSALAINAGPGGAIITGGATTTAGITAQNLGNNTAASANRTITTNGNVTFVGSNTTGQFIDGISTSGIFTAVTGTLTFDGTAGAASGYGVEVGVSGSWGSTIRTFGNVVFKGSGGTGRNSDLNLGGITGNGTITMIGRSKGLNTVGTFTSINSLPLNVVITTTAGGINGLLGSGTDNTGDGNYTVNAVGTVVLGAAGGARTINAGTGTISLTSGTGYSLLNNATLNAMTLVMGDTRPIAIANNFTLTLNTTGTLNNVIGTTAVAGKVAIAGGTVTLGGASIYTGTTTINGGILSINSIKSINAGASAVGAPTDATNGIISIGSTTAGGTLLYTGTGNTTDRVINLAGTTGGATLDQSGAGLLKFTTDFTATGVGSKTLTLQGSTAGSGEIGGAIVDGSGVTAVTKTGSNTWTLSGNNTFTGATTITAGTLNVTGSLANSPTVTIATAAILSGSGDSFSTGIINGAVSNDTGGGAISLTAGDNAKSLTINGLTLGNTNSYGIGNYTTLNFTLGSGITPLNVGTFGNPSGTLTVNSGGGYVSANGLLSSAGTYTLANFGSLIGGGNLSLSSTTAGVTTLVSGFNTLNLILNPTSLQLLITNTAIPVAYFKGGVSTVWNDSSSFPTSNWSSNLAGTVDAGNTPGALTDVILNSNLQTGTVSTTLGADTAINSLTANGNGTNTVAFGNTLTIHATTVNGHTLGDAITVGSTANAFTFNPSLVMGNSGANQTWTNASANLFTVGGNVTGTATIGNTQTLTLVNAGNGGTTINGIISDVTAGGILALNINNTGSGATTLGGANTFSGNTIITSGTLTLSNNLALQNSTLDTSGAGVMALTVTSPTFGGLIGSKDLTALITTGYGSITALTLNLATGVTDSYSGVISEGVVGTTLTKGGAGTQLLGGANTFTGGVFINAGVLQLANAGALNSITPNSLIFGANAPAGTALQLNGNSITVTGLNTNAMPGTPVVENASFTPATLTVNNATANMFAGVIQDGTGSSPLSLVKTGVGTLTLTGVNTYIGGTAVNQGTLNIGGGGTTGSIQTASVTVASGATLAYQFSNALSAPALTVTGNLSFVTTGALTITGTYGADTLTASGVNVNYTGTNLTINAGTGGATITGTSATLAGITAPNTSPNTRTITTNGNVNFFGTTTAGSFIDGISITGVFTATTGILTFDGVAGTAGAFGVENGVSGAYGGSISTFGNVVFKGTGGTTRNSDLSLGNITGNGTITMIGRSKGLNNNGMFTFSVTPLNVVITTTAGGINGLLGTGTDDTGGGNYTVNSAGSIAFGARTINAGLGTISLTSVTGYTVTANAALNAATLLINDATAITVNSTFALSLNATGVINNAIGGTGGKLTVNGGAITLTGASTYSGVTTVAGGTLQIGNAGSTGSLVPSSAITNNATLVFNRLNTITQGTDFGSIAGTGTLVQAGGGTLVLSSTNTYTGVTALNAGVLMSDTAGINGADITNGISFAGGTLQANTSGGLVTNKAITATSTILLNTTNGPITLGGSIASTTSGLTLTGVSTATLSGPNFYTGATTISSGTLNVTGSLDNTSVTISSGSKLSGTGDNISTGIIAGPVSNSAGGGTIALSAADSTKSLTVNGLTLGSTGSYGAGQYTTLAYSLGVSGISALNVGTAGSPTGLLTVNTGGAFVSITGSPVLGTYTLASFDNTSTGLNRFSLSSTTASQTSLVVGVNIYTLIGSATMLQLQITGTPIPTLAYFKGGVSTIWNDLTIAPTTNWSSDSAGLIDTGNAPGVVTDVILNASNQTGTISMTLGADTTINSLTVNNKGTNTLAAGNTLTINAANINGHTLGDAITLESTANAFTINAPLIMGNSGANQTWTNASASLFIVGGAVSGTASTSNTQTLTLANTGTGNTILSGTISNGSTGGIVAVLVNNSSSTLTTLAGNNTFTGGLTINGGVVVLGNADALNSTTPNTVVFGSNVAAGTSLRLNGNSVTFPSLTSDLFVPGLPTVENANATPVALTMNNLLDNTFAGVLQNGTGGGALSLVKNNIGILTLSGDNGFTGGVTINAGIIRAGHMGALNTTTPNSVTFGPGAVAGTSLQLNGFSLTLGGLNTDATPGTPVVENANFTPATLTISNPVANLFAGVIQDGSGGASLSLTKSGVGTLTLTAANTYTGGTAVTQGRLNVGNGGTTGSIVNGNITVDLGATLAYQYSSAFTANPLAVNGNLIYTSTAVLTLTAGTYGGNQITATGTNIVIGGALMIDAGSGGATISGTSPTVAGITATGSRNITTNGDVTFVGVSTLATASFLDGLSLGGVFTATTGTLTFDGTAGPLASYGIEAGVSGAYFAAITTVGNVVFKGTGGTGGPDLSHNSDLNLGPLTGNGTITMIGRNRGLRVNETFNATGGLPYNVVIQTLNGASVAGLLGTGTDNTADGNYTVNSAGSIAFGARTINAGLGTISLTSVTGYTVTNNAALNAATLFINDTTAITISSGFALSLNTTATINNAIGGTGGKLTVNGGAITLAAVNTYTGVTTVNGGILGGTGTISGPVTVASGTLRGDSGTGLGTLTVGSTTFSNTGTLLGTLGSSTNSSMLALNTSSLNFVTGTTLKLIGVAGFTTSNQATWTLATLSDGNNLTLDTLSVADHAALGSYIEGQTVFSPITFDFGNLGTSLVPGNQFVLSREGNALVLTFAPSAVPEPGLMLGLIALGLFTFRRKA
ncbi:autotransporter-associated beta strand repeat-containing protein [soil metagenome]